MAIKNKKKKTDNLNNEAHYFGALLENMDSKIDVILEGHQVLDKKIDDLSNNVDKRFNEVDYKFDVVFDELHLIRNDLKEKVGRDEFILLEKRVFALEKSRK
jgi:hypothetical protein